MSIRMLAARKTEKMESFYLFIFAKWFCIFANGYQLFRLEERNTSTAHRCIAIIQYYRARYLIYLQLYLPDGQLSPGVIPEIGRNGHTPEGQLK